MAACHTCVQRLVCPRHAARSWSYFSLSDDDGGASSASGSPSGGGSDYEPGRKASSASGSSGGDRDYEPARKHARLFSVGGGGARRGTVAGCGQGDMAGAAAPAAEVPSSRCAAFNQVTWLLCELLA